MTNPKLERLLDLHYIPIEKIKDSEMVEYVNLKKELSKQLERKNA